MVSEWETEKVHKPLRALLWGRGASFDDLQLQVVVEYDIGSLSGHPDGDLRENLRRESTYDVVRLPGGGGNGPQAEEGLDAVEPRGGVRSGERRQVEYGGGGGSCDGRVGSGGVVVFRSRHLGEGSHPGVTTVTRVG